MFLLGGRCAHTQAQRYAHPNVRPKHQAGTQGSKGPAGARHKEGTDNVMEEAKVAECLMVSDSRPSTVADELSRRMSAVAGCVDEEVVGE